MPPLSPSPKAGALLPPSNFPAGGFGDAASPRRASLPFAAEERPGLPRPGGSAKTPAAAHPGGRGVTCPHRAAGAPPSSAARDGAADPSPGRAVIPSNRPAGGGSPPAGRGGAAELLTGRAADRPLYAPDLVALVAVGLFVATLVLWLDAAARLGGA